MNLVGKRVLMGLVLGLWGMMAAAFGQDAAFPEPRNNERDMDAQPMPADQAAGTMRVPDGFQARLFAAEPEVQNPIDMAWDGRGRLWIAENYTYSDRQERFDLSLRDRVVVLADEDGDGVSDSRQVFVDDVQMLTSVEVGHGGVWLMCPPQLLFIADADHDAVPDDDAVQVVLDGFTVAKQNYHNFANGLRFGPDGWLYGRCGGSCPGKIGPPGTPESQRAALEGGMWRYHPGTGHYEVLTHGTTNPWGHDWDAYGEGFYINTVNGHFWHLIPGAHYKRPFTLDPNPNTYALIDMHADHWHFDTQGSWTDSREGAANDFGGGHAHCGMMVYLGDQWPERYRGAAMTINLHGKRVNHERLEVSGSGFVAKHEPDFMLSQDPFFRGMELSYGPDGSVMLIDWSDTGECHDHTGVHRTSGRVFEIRYVGESASDAAVAKSPPVDLYQASDLELARMQTHANAWYVRQARLELARRGRAGDLDRRAVELLSAWCREADGMLAYRAMLTLHVMGHLSNTMRLEMLGHDDPHVRAWAIRLWTEAWPLDDCFGPWDAPFASSPSVSDLPLQRWVEMAREDPSGLVRLTLASTLQRLPLIKRLRLAEALASREEDADDHNLPLLVWYGLMPVAEVDAPGLAVFARHCRWPLTQRLAVRRLAAGIDRWPSALVQVTGALRKMDPATRLNVLRGIADGLEGWQRAPRPDGWSAMVAQLEPLGDAAAMQLVREIEVVFGSGRAVDAMRAVVLDDSAEIGLRRSALETLVRNRTPGLRDICLPLLRDARVNVIAAEGLATLEDPAIGEALIDAYRRFRAPERPKVVAILASRASWAGQLLAAVQRGAIPADDLSAYDVRQIRSMGDAELNEQLARVWGHVRETPEARAVQIRELKNALTAERLGQADLSAGRRLFQATCQQCHRLYGEGEQVGPELTGGNRGNLDYLIENIVDPSAVVSKDFRMSVVLLDDGRVLNGLVLAEQPRTLELQLQNERRVIDKRTIEEIKITSQSPMPEGLLDALSETQVRDLMAYLMHPTQVPLPPATVSGSDP